jgi:hypothetical protein
LVGEPVTLQNQKSRSELRDFSSSSVNYRFVSAGLHLV